MSGAATDQAPRSAVPVPDLSAVDEAITLGAEALREAVRRFRPADLGRDLSRRTTEEGRRILEALEERRGAAMLAGAHPSVAGAILSAADPALAARLLGFLPTDHQVAIAAQVSTGERQRVEATLTPAEKATLDRLLGYPESAVGRLMTPKIWRCPRAATAAEAMAVLKGASAQIEVAVNCYVVDGEKLVGVVPLREMAIAAAEARVEEMMTRNPLFVSEETERGDAAEIIRTHDFLSLPVVDKGGALLGAVRVDDLLDAALDKVGAGMLNQGAVQGGVAGAVPYFQTSLGRVVRSRITWLILLFVAETATGTVLRHFEGELAKVVALSFFVPLLIGTGGNAGSQTVSTVIRALALGEVRVRDVMRVVRKEILAGLLLGLLLGTIAFFRALLWGVTGDLAACVAVTILVVCTWANAVGATVPLLAQKLKIDPTVISAPLITTLVDASGLFIYFSVAHLMIASLR